MNDIIEIILKIIVAILSLTGMAWIINIFIRKIYFINHKRKTAKDLFKFAYLILDIDKTRENTEFIVKEISNELNSGKLSYIDKILLFDKNISPDFFKSLQSVHNIPLESENEKKMQNKFDENIKMCEIISRNYTNVFYLK